MNTLTTHRMPGLFATDNFTFDDAFRNFMRPFRWDAAVDLPQIRMDVSEMDKAFVVRAELPGVRKEDIHVEIEGSQVMISAEVRREFDEKKDGRLLRSERGHGMMTRVFSLGTEIDRNKAVAKYDDGLLTLTLPRKVSAKSEALVVQ